MYYRGPLRLRNEDDGMGLIEIVIAMFILALLSLSFLPLLISSLKSTSTNRTIAAASQVASGQMELGRAAAGATTATCAAMKTFANASPLATTTASQGIVLQPRRQLVVSAATASDGCPLTYPGTVKFRTWVTQVGKATVLASATTLIYVGAAS